VESLFWFVVLIGVLIFAHEGGHFTFAKLFKVKVLTFSLGFGTPIRIGKFKLSFKPSETEYRIAWFPVGGFVRMLGDDPTEEIPEDEKERAFSTQKAWKRFLIIFGGPLFSILLAVPIYFVYHLLQDTAPAPVVGSVVPGSPAAEAGIQPMDRIEKVGDVIVETWEDIDRGIQDSSGSQVEIALERSGKTLEFEATPWREIDETGLELMGERWDIGIRHERQFNILGVVGPDSPARRAGLQSWDKLLELGGVPVDGWWDASRLMAGNGLHLLPATVVRGEKVKLGPVSLKVPVLVDTIIRPVQAVRAPRGAMVTGDVYTGLEAVDLYVHSVTKDKPAEKHGIKPGDKIISVNGKEIFSWEQFSRIVSKKGDKQVFIEVRHLGKIRKIEFKPEIVVQKNEFKQETKKLGLGVSYKPNFTIGQRMPRPRRLANALVMAVVSTGNAIAMNVVGFVRIFEGRVKPTEAIGGPLMIADIAGKSAKKGWRYFVQMMAFLSTLLGLLNLLPIPILDGGHIAFIIIEGIMGRPVSIKARVMASYVGLILLAGLMIFAFGNDIHRYWSEITSVFG